MDKLIYDSGFGILPKKVMIDTNLSLQAKGLFAYLVTYAGNGDTAFPSRSLISHQLGISKDTFTKYLKELKDKGYIEVYKTKREKGKFSNNIYKLIPCPKLSDTVTPDTVTPDTVNQDTNINNNNINNNNINSSYIKKKKKETSLDLLIKEYTTNNLLIETLVDFMKMRKTIKKPLTDRALKGILNKLDKLVCDDAKKIEILEQSIENCWSGVFPLKEYKSNNSISQKNKNIPVKTRFHNLAHESFRDYNPDELERLLLESQKKKF